MKLPKATILGCAALALVVLTPTLSAAQIPDEFTNLQLLPEDIGKRELINKMKGMTLSLGVRCPFCHVGEEGEDLSTFDFASDAKPMKNVARAMMRMTHQINAKFLADIETEFFAKEGEEEEKHEAIAISCNTCHRGETHPAK